MDYTYVHGVLAGRLLASVTLGKRLSFVSTVHRQKNQKTYPEERVGERVLAEVGENLILDLEGGEVGCIKSDWYPTICLSPRTRLGDSLLGVGLLDGSLVASGVDELVVHDLDGGVVGREGGNLVGNGSGIGEGRDVLANTSEAENEVLGVGTAQLRLALLTENGKIRVRVREEHGPDLPRHTRVDTTAEALVGAADDNQCLLLLVGDGLGLGALEDGVGGLAVCAGGGHGLLGAGELGRGDNLHGLGDLLDVANRLETALDFTESGIAGSVGGGEGGRSADANLVST
jgi:hypothetical protein